MEVFAELVESDFDGALHIPLPRHSSFLARACLACAQPMHDEIRRQVEVDATQVGVFFAFDGMCFDRAPLVSELRDCGPMEYLNTFHHLHAFHFGNFFHITGPIMTFSDAEYGLRHALDQAQREMARGGIKTAIVIEAIFRASFDSLTDATRDRVRIWLTQNIGSVRASLKDGK